MAESGTSGTTARGDEPGLWSSLMTGNGKNWGITHLPNDGIMITSHKPLSDMNFINMCACK